MKTVCQVSAPVYSGSMEIAENLIKARGDDPEKVRAAMRERTRIELGLPTLEELRRRHAVAEPVK